MRGQCGTHKTTWHCWGSLADTGQPDRHMDIGTPMEPVWHLLGKPDTPKDILLSLGTAQHPWEQPVTNLCLLSAPRCWQWLWHRSHLVGTRVVAVSPQGCPHRSASTCVTSLTSPTSAPSRQRAGRGRSPSHPLGTLGPAGLGDTVVRGGQMGGHRGPWGVPEGEKVHSCPWQCRVGCD